MSVLAHVGSFSIAAGTSNVVTVTGIPFQPKAVLFFWAQETTATVSPVNLRIRGFGVLASDNTQTCAFASVFPGESAGFAQHGYSLADVVMVTGFLAGHMTRIEAAMTADGFTLTPRFTNTVNVSGNYIAWGGTDITDTKVMSFQAATSDGNQDITDLGFEPDVLIAVHSGINNLTTPTATSVGSEVSLGFAAGDDLVQGCWTGKNYRQLGDVMAHTYCCFDDLFVIQELVSSVPTATMRGRVTAWLSNGFRVNWTNTLGNYRFSYLAIKGGIWGVNSVNTRADTQQFDIPMTFNEIPSSTVFVSGGNPESATGVVDEDDRLSIGAVVTEGFGQRSGSYMDVDGEDPDVSFGDTSAEDVYIRLYIDSLGSETTGGKMRVVDAEAGKYIGQMSTIDNTANFVLYLASAGEEIAEPEEPHNVARPSGCGPTLTPTPCDPECPATPSSQGAQAATIADAAFLSALFILGLASGGRTGTMTRPSGCGATLTGIIACLQEVA